ncbi:hypothetical protein uvFWCGRAMDCOMC493_011 [Freshwater phage uvFW-CGR-AMD-COM-C493]|nr:hypothetical protein uvFWCGRAMDCOMC493_011 [Freshwater phage uvFW-CGR-AMD-COM-C493]
MANKEKVGAWAIISGSKKDKNAVYGAKVYEGQGVVKSGDLVSLVNWKGQATLVRIDKKVKTVGANPAKGEMAYTVYTIAK